ncbi:EthD family reductase [Salipiger sp. P9]|uniref:EthD domain-containing protein n=1 Tax=Salipiger pentaromativorans TaxID=2943193 RepID=UPI002157BAFC|nr:EthD family reductase [Salipiger pentaromativorans]MCR8550637.1 EthD family reductase [Salipiger pentaromativorans]
MITRFGLLKRSPKMTPEAFDAYWRDVHGPLATALPNLKAYFHHTVVERGDHAILGPWELDGLSELHFDDLESMRAAFATASGEEAKDDLSLFLEDMHLVVCEQHAVIPAQLPEGPVVSRMSLIKRKPGMSDEAFRREWLEVHAEMMHKWPNVLGYNQNLVIDRFHTTTAQSATYDEVPVDGIVQIWFPSEEKAAETHATEIVAETLAHARDFLSEITPFLVRTRRIV